MPCLERKVKCLEEVLKISAILVAVCLLTAVVGQGSRVMGLLIVCAAGFACLFYALERGAAVLERLREIAAAAGIESQLAGPVLQVLGISLCGRLTSELCRDMGSRWAAGSIEIFSVIAACICLLPLLEQVLRLVGSL